MIRCAASLVSGQQCFNSVLVQGQMCPFHQSILSTPTNASHQSRRAHSHFDFSGFQQIVPPNINRMRGSVVVDSNTASRDARLQNLCSRLGVSPDRESLLNALMMLPTEQMRPAMSQYSLLMEPGQPNSPQRTRFSQALIESVSNSGIAGANHWNQVSSSPTVNSDFEQKLMQAIEKIKSKLAVLHACDAQLVQTMSTQVKKWTQAPSPQLLQIETSWTIGIDGKLSALFGDLTDIFAVNRSHPQLGYTVSLLPSLPDHVWVKAIPMMFEAHLDNDVQMSDGSSPFGSLPSTWNFGTSPQTTIKPFSSFTPTAQKSIFELPKPSAGLWSSAPATPMQPFGSPASVNPVFKFP